MGIFNLLIGRKRDKSELKGYPEAVSLAQRHIEEFDVMVDAQPSVESLQNMEAKQKVELVAATRNMSDSDSAQFTVAYHTEWTSLMKASAEARSLRFANENPELAENKSNAENFAAAIEKGDSVPSWVLDAFERGRRDGRCLALADENNLRQLSADRQNATTNWLESLPSEMQSMGQYMYDKGRDKGTREGAEEYAKSYRPEENAPLNKTSFWDLQTTSIRFLAGDLGKGKGHLLASGKVRIPDGTKDFSMSAVTSVEVATEESVKRIGGALGWGLPCVST